MIGLETVLRQLQTTLFVTGAFCVAWAWDLVVYAISHVRFGEDPLDNQLAFGNQHAPKYLAELVLQYLVVCGGAAAMSNYFRRHDGQRQNNAAILMAIEFFPSPIFAGKLMAYLSQFRLEPLHQALLNLAATWFSAFLAHMASSHSSDATFEDHAIGFWQRTCLIVKNNLGFGLGIAWNVLLAQWGPDDDSQWNMMHLLALVAYLGLVLVIALKLAAMVPDDNPMTLWERHLSLLAFAMYVVCGFTVVGFLKTLLGDGWIGSLQSFGIVLALATVMSTMVAVADLDGMGTNAEEYQSLGYDEESTHNHADSARQNKSSKYGVCGGIFNCLVFVPCVWCCCPWIPLLILLAGMTESVNVKEHWFRLIAMVAGLACSIEASTMLTSATDSLAVLLGICGHRHCYQPCMFVLLQVGLAVVCTMIILPIISPFSPSWNTEALSAVPDLSSLSSAPPSEEDALTIWATPTLAPSAPSSEDQPLLYHAVAIPVVSPPPPHNPKYDPNRM